MSARMKAVKTFDKKVYAKRELAESAFSSIKRKYGGSVSSKRARTIRSEIYGRLACHNIVSFMLRLLGQSPMFHNIY